MYSKYLIHYNHNHDRLGRFARSAGSAGSKVGSAVLSSGKKKKKQQPPKADIKKGKAANTKLSDKERKRIVESGDAREVAKNKDRLSTRELESAVTRLQREKIQRIDLEKKLSDLSDGGKQRQTAIQKIEKYGNDLERISNGVEKAMKMYNTAARVHNVVASGNDQWPIYGEKKKGDKKKEKTKQELDWEKRGLALKENNLRNKEREAAQKKRELDDNDRKYIKDRMNERETDRRSNIRVQSYNSDNDESSYYSDKIYNYAADGEGKYYTERDYEKKKKLRHSDLVDLGEDWLMSVL